MKTFKFVKGYTRAGRGYRAGDIFRTIFPPDEHLARQLVQDGILEVHIHQGAPAAIKSSKEAAASTTPQKQAPVQAHQAGTPEGRFALDVIQSWKNDPSVRAEFQEFNTYRAWREAEARGLIKVRGKGGQSEGGAPAVAPATPHRSKPTDQDIEAEWRTSPKLRAEFSQLETYLAYRRAQTGQLRHPLYSRVNVPG